MHALGGNRRRLDGRGRRAGLAPDRLGEGSFSFVQISDSHIGFSKPANPDAHATLAAAIDRILAMPGDPAFIIHTGDVTHSAQPKQFDDALETIKRTKLDVRYAPGEHDIVDGPTRAAYLDRFGKGATGGGWYSFDHGGVHFVSLVNVVDLKKNGLGSLGAEQLEWLEDDLRGKTASTPIVLFCHIPLWMVAPDWGWGTEDSAQALGYLARFGSVTVLNGHIHQLMQAGRRTGLAALMRCRSARLTSGRPHVVTSAGRPNTAGGFRPAMDPTKQSNSRTPLDEAGALLGLAAGLLYVNGQTTRTIVERVQRLARALGCSAKLLPSWGEIVIHVARLDEPDAQRIVPVSGPPVSVDMNKVMKTLEVVDAVSAGRLDIAEARAALEDVARLKPASTLRFAAFAGIGAAALGVIFGAERFADLVLIGLSATAGALLRRLIASQGGGPLIQIVCAGLLAGLVAALTVSFTPSANAYLIALCPCMVLMPGAHLLNAALDFAHLRMALGQARFAFAMLLTLLICVGLIAGLSVARQSLPPPGPVGQTPLAFDVLSSPCRGGRCPFPF